MYRPPLRTRPVLAREFYEQIKGASPRQQFAFLMGPLGTCRSLGQVNSPRVTPRADSGQKR